MKIVARALRSSLESAAVAPEMSAVAVTYTALRANEAAPGQAIDETPDPAHDR